MCRSDSENRESVHVNEWDNVTKDDVDADVELVKIALPSISAGSPSE